jgi:hypothetical protein
VSVSLTCGGDARSFTDDIATPSLSDGTKDWHGFERARLVSVLKGIATGADMEPVPLLELPQHDIWPVPYQYRVRDGFHRFYASIVAGFESVPAVIT